VDRFMLKVVINYPKQEEEKLILRQNITNTRAITNKVIKTEDILKARMIVREVYLDEKIENYITDIVFASRFPKDFNLDKFEHMISYGASPRASINLALALLRRIATCQHQSRTCCQSICIYQKTWLCNP